MVCNKIDINLRKTGIFDDNYFINEFEDLNFYAELDNMVTLNLIMELAWDLDEEIKSEI